MPDFINQDKGTGYIIKCEKAFKQELQILCQKPAASNSRECTDVICLAIFIIFTIGFLSYGGYSINNLVNLGQHALPFGKTDIQLLEGITIEQVQIVSYTLFGALGLSNAISILVCFALKFYPQYTVFVMSFTTVIIIIATGIYDFFIFKSGFGSYFFGIALIYALMIFSLWQKLNHAAILMKTVGMFVLQNLKIVLVLLFSLIYCLIVLVIWLIGLYNFLVMYSNSVISQTVFIICCILWGFLLVFFNFYFYYTGVFLTCSSLAIWFYQKNEMSIVITPFKMMARFHLGTITFASIIISLVKFFKLILYAAMSRQYDGICGMIGNLLSCIIFFCCGAFQALTQTINTYAIIVCSLSGKSLLQSAKIVGKFAFQYESIFSDFAMATHFIRAGGTLLISSIPTLLACLILGPSIGNVYLFILSSLVVMFTCTIIGLVYLQVFVDSVCSLFILYFIDNQLTFEGKMIQWVQRYEMEIEKGFEEAFIGRLPKMVIKKKKITTIIVHPNGVQEVYKRKVQKIEEQSENHINMNDIK